MKLRTKDGVTTVHSRWMVRRDMREIMAIEREVFDDPLFEEEFTRELRQRHCIGLVAEVKGEVAGYVVYLLGKDYLRVTNFAVRPDLQRMGVGRAMWQQLVMKLTDDRRRRILLSVRQDNLKAQKFFQSLWCLCIGEIGADETENGVDGYEFEYLLDPADRDAAFAAVVTERVAQGSV
jgi:ribosomal-protein-alanine N-acetyltransferase